MSSAPSRSPAAAAAAADRSGAVALLFALLLPVLIGVGALALDAGQLYLQRRLLQGAADAAALAVAARPAEGPALARRILDANGQDAAAFTLLFGHYEAGEAGSLAPRFVADGNGPTVRVEARLSSELHLARIFGIAPPAISALADASLSPTTSLSAGSRLASVEPALLSSLVKPILGVDLGLTALDYTALGRARIDLGALLAAAATVDGSGPATTIADLSGSSLRLAPLLQAMAGELDRAGEPVAASLLMKASRSIKTSPAAASLASLLSLDGETAASTREAAGMQLDAKLSVLEVVNALIGSAAADRSRSLSLTVPGLAAVDLEMMVGDPMQAGRPLAVSAGMPGVETAQIRLRLRVRTAGALDLLNLRLEVPLELVVAGGTAQVIAARCSSDPAQREVRVAVRPGVAKLALGAWSGPLSSASIAAKPAKADLINAGIASVKAVGLAKAESPSDVVLVFRGAEIGNGTTKTARSTSLVGGLTGSVIANTQIDVQVGVIGIPLLGLRDSVGALLAAVVQPVDALLDAVLASVGIGLGEMDVRVDDLVCDQSRIVG